MAGGQSGGETPVPIPNTEQWKVMKMNETLARIVGHLMGDGCVTSRYIRYANKEQALLQQFERDIRRIDRNIHIIKGKVNSGTPFIQIQKKELLQRLQSLGEGKYKSERIEIPSLIRKNLKAKVNFIRALFDDEGSVSLRIHKKTGETKRDIHIALKSKKMIFQLKEVLEKEFGIKCNKIGKDERKRKNKKYVTWVLRITGYENIKKFKEKIGFTHPQKNKILKNLLLSYKKHLPLRES